MERCEAQAGHLPRRRFEEQTVSRRSFHGERSDDHCRLRGGREDDHRLPRGAAGGFRRADARGGRDGLPCLRDAADGSHPRYEAQAPNGLDVSLETTLNERRRLHGAAGWRAPRPRDERSWGGRPQAGCGEQILRRSVSCSCTAGRRLPCSHLPCGRGALPRRCGYRARWNGDGRSWNASHRVWRDVVRCACREVAQSG